MSDEPPTKRQRGPGIGGRIVAPKNTSNTPNTTSTATGSDDVLGSVLSGMQSTMEQARVGTAITRQLTVRSTETEMSSKTSVGLDESLAIFLSETKGMVMAQLDVDAGGVVEVEIRLGHICKRGPQEVRLCGVSPEPAVVEMTEADMKSNNAIFKAGVPERDFHNLVSSFSGHTTTSQDEVLQFEGFRSVKDSQDGTVKHESKRRIATINYMLPHCPFDIRVMVAIETPVPESEEMDYMEPKITRKRERTSVHKAPTPALTDIQLDFTRVETVSHDHTEAPGTTFEVEFEVSPNVTMAYFLHASPPQNEFPLPQSLAHNAHRPLARIITALWRTACHVMPQMSEPARVSAKAAVRCDFSSGGGGRGSDPTCRAVWDACMAAVSSVVDDRVLKRFIGTMPVGFAKRHFELLKDPQHDYYASEKTDGTRYLLVIANNQAHLVDRSYSLFKVPGLMYLAKVFQEGTVLDGEIALNTRERRPYFVVFDALRVLGEVVTPFKFSVRLERIRLLLDQNSAYDLMMRDQSQQNAALPVVRKDWYPVKHIRNIFERIRPTKDGKRLYNDKRKRTHHTDGIVFSPNGEYVPGNHEGYFKWKWADQVTIDFLASWGNNGIELVVEGPNETKVPFTAQVGLGPQTRRAIVDQLEARGSVVVELGFNKADGLWHMKTFRFDKNKGNFIVTALDALLQLAEGVDQDELQRTLGVQPQHNHQHTAPGPTPFA